MKNRHPTLKLLERNTQFLTHSRRNQLKQLSSCESFIIWFFSKVNGNGEKRKCYRWSEANKSKTEAFSKVNMVIRNCAQKCKLVRHKLHWKWLILNVAIDQTTVFRLWNEMKWIKSLWGFYQETLQTILSEFEQEKSVPELERTKEKSQSKEKNNWTWTMLRDNGNASSHKYVWRPKEMHEKI